MKQPLSRSLSIATAGYAIYALVYPRHLGKVLTNDPLKQPDYDLVATTFGVRDLVVSALALAAPTPTAREHAMCARVLLDLCDAASFSPEAHTAAARNKVLGATLTWAAINAAAVVVDRRR